MSEQKQFPSWIECTLCRGEGRNVKGDECPVCFGDCGWYEWPDLESVEAGLHHEIRTIRRLDAANQLKTAQAQNT